MGDLDSENTGRFGLWQSCQRDDIAEKCYGNLWNILQMESIAHQVATVFVGISVITALITIVSLVLMLFMKSTTVFHICGWFQVLSGKYIFTYRKNENLRNSVPPFMLVAICLTQTISCLCNFHVDYADI